MRISARLVAALTTVLALLAASIAAAPVQSTRVPFRVAVAGMVHGHVGSFLSAALQRSDIQIVGIAESNQQVARRYASQFGLDSHLLYTDLEKMLTKVRPQALLVYTDTHDHRRVVETAALHHIPVMMEKPLAISMEDALAIKRAADGAHIPVLVNYETTWYPSNAAIYQLLREGMLGEIRKVTVHSGHGGPKEIGVPPEFLAWLTDPARNGGGALFDFGCYGADLVTGLMNGAAPINVTAVTQQFKPDVYPHVEDEATVILTYPRAQAIIQASWNWPFGRKDMEVYGDKGQAITVGRDGILVRRQTDNQERQPSVPALAPPYNDSLSFLIGVVSGEIKPEGLSSLETNITVMRILEAARKSAQSGTTIRLAGR